MGRGIVEVGEVVVRARCLDVRADDRSGWSCDFS